MARTSGAANARIRYLSVRHLNLVSYNIHKGLSAGNRRTVLSGIRDALDELAPDIVLLQEVRGEHSRKTPRFPRRRTEPQAQFIARGLRHACAYGENVMRAHGGHGNAVLSHFPFRQSHNIELSVNRWERRGMLHTIVETPGGDVIHVACVHLNLRDRDRARQLREIGYYIERNVPQSVPLIIGGDFNDWRNAASHLLADQLGLLEVIESRHHRLLRTFPSWRPVISLDRIYVRHLDIEHAEVPNANPWRSLSDHLPVFARLEVRKVDLESPP